MAEYKSSEDLLMHLGMQVGGLPKHYPPGTLNRLGAFILENYRMMPLVGAEYNICTGNEAGRPFLAFLMFCPNADDPESRLLEVAVWENGIGEEVTIVVDGDRHEETYDTLGKSGLAEAIEACRTGVVPDGIRMRKVEDD